MPFMDIVIADISNNISSYELIGLVPIYYLGFISFLDLIYDFSLKSYFCQTADEIHRKIEDLRGEGQEWECTNLTSDYKLDKCPLFYSLHKSKKNFHKTCPQIFDAIKIDQSEIKHKDQFWTIIRKGFIRSNQASYFEIFTLQFFVIYLTAEVQTVRYIAFLASIFIFVALHISFQYVIREPFRHYENKWSRLIIIISCAIICIGLYSVPI